MSDRIAVMSEGRVEQIGAPEEIYHQPASVFVAGFIGDGEPAAGRRSSRRDGDVATVDVAATGTARRRRRPTGCAVGDAGDAHGPARADARLRRRAADRDVGLSCTVVGPRVPGPGRALRAARTATAARSSRTSAPTSSCRCCGRATRVWAGWEPRCGTPAAATGRVASRARPRETRRDPSLRSAHESRQREPLRASERRDVGASSSAAPACSPARCCSAPAVLAACGGERRRQRQRRQWRRRRQQGRRDLELDRATSTDAVEEATSRRTPGSSVDYDEDINDNNEYFAKIRPNLRKDQSIGRDGFVLTDWMANRLINQVEVGAAVRRGEVPEQGEPARRRCSTRRSTRPASTARRGRAA